MIEPSFRDSEDAQSRIAISSPLLAELLDPESWSPTLERFGRTLSLAVAMTDIHGGALGVCHNPQPIWLEAQNGLRSDRAACPFCLSRQPACGTVEEALRLRKVTMITDSAGLAHVAVPLSLNGQPLGALLAGQVFVDYPQPLALERLAKDLKVAGHRFWPLAVQRPPTRPSALHVYGELLESLGHAFVRERYAAVLARKLKLALEEKTVLLHEVHHRVKNNMAVMASLLGLQAASASSEETASQLRTSQQRVYSMASIHEHLYDSESLKYIRFDEYATHLASELSASYSSPGGPRIQLDLDPIELGIAQALPCGLILNEWITNALKYAFPNGRLGTIAVTVIAAGPGLVEMSVQDDGVGLPGDFRLEDTRSLGLRIVQLLTAQLSGKFEARPGPGARFSLTFPVLEGAEASY